MKIGTTDINSIKKGTTTINKVYSGSTEVFTNNKWSFVFIPDPQELASHTTQSYTDLIQYIVDQRSVRNIKMVLNVGDTVDLGTSSAQWTVADNANALMEGKIPYLIGIGNHDYDDDSGTIKTATSFNNAYPLATYQTYDWFIQDVTEYPTGESVNTAAKITVGSISYLFLNIEYLPRTSSVTWAQAVVDAHTDVDYIIVSNHYFLDGVGTRSTDTTVTALWNDFISQNSKIRLVLCGHIPGTTTAPAVAKRTDGLVHQHVLNAQTMTGNNYDASAFLRFYEVNEDDHSVSVTTYNPITDTSLTDSENQFSFNL